MAIKEIKGRTLPGRSEEPSPDRPTTTVSGADEKRGATEHQRERSAFEQRQPGEHARRRDQRGTLEKSAFEREARILPRPHEAADPLERYPHSRVLGDPTEKDWLEGERTEEEAPPPDDSGLWGDGYEEQESEAEEESEGDEERFAEDLWSPREATAKVDAAADASPLAVDHWEGIPTKPSAVDPALNPELAPSSARSLPTVASAIAVNEPLASGSAAAPPAKPVTEVASPADHAREVESLRAPQAYRPSTSASETSNLRSAAPATVEVPAVLTPLPRGAVAPASDPPTQEVTAVEAGRDLLGESGVPPTETTSSSPLGSSEPDPTETVEPLRPPD